MHIDPSNGALHLPTSIPAIFDAIMMVIEVMITYIQDNISLWQDRESANNVIQPAAPALISTMVKDAHTVLPLQHSLWTMIYVGAPIQQLITIYARPIINALPIAAQQIYISGSTEVKQLALLISSPTATSHYSVAISAISAINTAWDAQINMIINARIAQLATICGSNTQPAAITTAYKDPIQLVGLRDSMWSRHQLVPVVHVILVVNFVRGLRISAINARITIIYWMIERNVLLLTLVLCVLIRPM